MDPKNINTNPISNSTLGTAPVVDDSAAATSDIETPQNPVISTVSEPAAAAPAQPVDDVPYTVPEEPTAPEPTVSEPVDDVTINPGLSEPTGVGTPMVENTVMPDADAPEVVKPTGVGTPMVENTVMPDADAPVAPKPVNPVGSEVGKSKFQV